MSKMGRNDPCFCDGSVTSGYSFRSLPTPLLACLAYRATSSRLVKHVGPRDAISCSRARHGRGGTDEGEPDVGNDPGLKHER
jgi:hypothetical protein